MLAVSWLISFNAYAVDYVLPADIGNGPFANCSGSGPYTCAGNVEIQFPDTVTLTAPVTLNVTAEFKVDDFAGPVNAADIYTMTITANRGHIDGDEIVNINLTTSGDIIVHKSATVVGDLESTGGDIDIDDNSTVDGVCDPDHPQCNGGGGGPGPGLTCTTTIVDAGVEFRAISGSSDVNIFAVGKDGSIYHYEITPPATTPTWNLDYDAGFELREIEVISTGEAWAVGKGGNVLEYNGGVWSELLPKPTGEELRGVWAASNSEVWVVGKGQVHRWDGVWIDEAPVPGLGKGELRSAWGDLNYFYAAEKDGDLYRHSRPAVSGAWEDPRITACNDGEFEVERIWGSGTGDIYLAGKSKGKGKGKGKGGATIFRYDEGDGMCYPEFSTNSADKFNGIDGNGSTVYAVGKDGLIVENTSGSWVETIEGADEFKDVWVSNTNTAYYAGKNGSITVCTDNSAAAIVDYFVITPTYSPTASTCLANAITIEARNSDDDPVVDYTNLINISVQTRNHGNWSEIGPPSGRLDPDPDTDDNGAVTYTFSLLDSSSVTLNLTNTHAGTVFIRINDPAESVTTDSGNITFSENVLVVTEDDALQIAGKPKPMKITMVTDDTASSGSCGRDPNYNSASQDLEVDIIRSVDDPGGNAPLIGVLDLPNTVSFDFSGTQPGEIAGEASFNLLTNDVGKYRLDVIDETSNHSGLDIITGTSPELTMRPFGIAVTSITGLMLNTNNDTPTGDVFALAGTDFSAIVEAVLWDTNDDPDGDGVINVGRVFADNLPALKAPSYAWNTTLRVPLIPAGFTPTSGVGGVQGNLYNGALLLADFTTGTASPTNLQYDEVGSFTLQSTATNYLNTLGADFDGDDIIVGRFIPASFALIEVEPGMLAGSCPMFAYIGEPMGYDVLQPAFLVRPLDGRATPNVTSNYIDDWAKLDDGSVTFTHPTADLSQDGSDAATKMAISFSHQDPMNRFDIVDNTDGTYIYRFRDDEYIYDKDPNSEIPNFDSDIELDITDLTDTDMVTNSANLVLNPTFIDMRFGRVRMSNVHGSELTSLLMPMVVEYLDSVTGRYIVNNLDNMCTTIDDLTDLVISDNMIMGSSTPTIDNSPASMGIFNLTFSIPGAGNTGYIDVTPDLGATGADVSWLKYDWTLGAGVFNENPTGRATFGIYQGNDVNIYKSQTYQ